MKMTFNDFFVYHGKAGIFFAVQVGALASVAVMMVVLRHHRTAVELLAVEKVRAWVPTWLMLALVTGLALTSVFDPEFKWLAGTYTMALGVIGLGWYRFVARRGSVRRLVRQLDWDTTLFLIGVFVVVGGLSSSGWLERLADLISSGVGSNLAVAFVVIVAVSMVVSGFVDNVPFLLVMIPVVQKVADTVNTPAPLLMFGLLIGACLGGNITPIGASANVVAIGILRKNGHAASFREFMALGIPFTLAAVAAACAFVWAVWAP
jgi:Na+/H+ antiporter NhaD/arsenite permease-like protein